MHKHKRVLTSAVAMILCIVTLFTTAFALPSQDATIGFPAPPSVSGSSGGSPDTSYNSTIIVGYRFTCWRSTDYENALKSMSAAEAKPYLDGHYDPGYKLGHSINIIVNTTGRWDYANGYGQTGDTAPRMYTDEYYSDFLDKISVAQLEIANDKELGSNKITHATSNEIITLHYQASGNYNGTGINGGATFKFTKPLYSQIDNLTPGHPNYDPQKPNNTLGSMTDNASELNPIIIHSGYFTKYNDPKEGYIGPDNDLHTYIYGIEYSEKTSATGGKDTDFAKDGIYTIADVDDHTANVDFGATRIGDTVAFNQNPYNVLASGNPNSWTNMNASLIATLCGLEPVYGERGETDTEFGLNDFIIVEPLYMVYYFYERFFITATDIGVLQSDGQAEVYGKDGRDCWNVAINGGYTWWPNSSKFPGLYGTYMFATDYYFGVDGVMNGLIGSPAADEGNEYVEYKRRNGAYYHILTGKMDTYYKNVYDTLRVAVDNGSATEADKQAYFEMQRLHDLTGSYRPNANTNAVVNSTYHSSSGNYYSVFVGAKSWWYGKSGYMSGVFVAPRVSCESMIGAGVWTANDGNEPGYKIVYHSNYYNGTPGGAQDVVVHQTFESGVSAIKLADYIGTFGQLPTDAAGKIGTNIWTYGTPVADNALHSYTGDKDSVGFEIKTNSEIAKWFDSHNAQLEGNYYTLHLYAAWDTKALLTTLDRTYSDAIQTVPQAQALGQLYNSEIKSIALYNPKDGSLVPFTKAPIQSGPDTLYCRWTPSGNISGGGYIVYSFTKENITKAEAQSAYNGNIGDVMLYGTRANKADAYWHADGEANDVNRTPSNSSDDITMTSIFYLDFYTFSITAESCSGGLFISNTPGMNTVNTQGEALGDQTLSLVIPRGAKVYYKVNTDEKNGYRFQVNADAGTWQDYQNTAGGTAVKYIKTEGSQANNVHTATKETEYEYTVNVLQGKQTHHLKPVSSNTLMIIPHLDDTGITPFTDYYVKVYNHQTRKETTYAANGNGATMDANGVVKIYVVGGGTYDVSVTVAEGAGTQHMSQVAAVAIPANPGGQQSTTTVNVYYYSTTINVSSVAGGNHSGTQVTLSCVNAQNSDETYSSASTQPKSTSKSDALCNNAYDGYVRLISLKGTSKTDNNSLTSVVVTRESSPDWYLTGSNVSDDSHYSDETNKGGQDWQYTNKVLAKHTRTYTFAPYHTIQFKLDGNLVDYTTFLSSAPTGYEAVSRSGFKALRGKYTSSIDFYSIFAPNRTKYANDKIAINYTSGLPYNTNLMAGSIILEYNTVIARFDDGYTVANIYANNNATSIGNTAYILDRADLYGKYYKCTPNNPQDMSDNDGEYVTSVNNTKSYNVKATLKSTIQFRDVTVSGALNVNGTTYPTDEVNGHIVKNANTSVSISRVTDPSVLLFRSKREMLNENDFKFIFYINDVPYDSLSDTINANISLNGTERLVFTGDNKNIATAASGTEGQIAVGTYNLYLDGKDTGMSYQIKKGSVYEIRFYTLRVAAGTGISRVSIAATDMGSKWNGTLKYMRDGQTDSSTLAVWPASMTDSTKKIYIDAYAYNDYTFNRWETKRPTSGSKVTYGSTTNSTSTNTANTYVVANQINHATVLQAEATTQGTPIRLPVFPEHNSIYYDVVVRTFLDGRTKTPWSGLFTDITVNGTTKSTAVINGLAGWATVLDEYNPDGTAIPNPYVGKSAFAVIAPSKEFQDDDYINKTHYYEASAGLKKNERIYIDVIYWTQTIQTTINGVPNTPWSGATAQYTMSYKDATLTVAPTLSDRGHFSTIMVQDLSMQNQAGEWDEQAPKISVNGMTYQGGIYRQEHAPTVVWQNPRSFYIPYYSVTMKAQYQTKDNLTDITCPALSFNGVNMKNNQVNVMSGTYNIATSDGCHTWLDWAIAQNRVFKLEYKDSGDGINPFPTLIYTGESRNSLSVIPNPKVQSTTIRVTDETNLVARYGTPGYDLTLHAKPAYLCLNCPKVNGYYRLISCTDSHKVIETGACPYCHSEQVLSAIDMTANSEKMLCGISKNYPAGTHVLIDAKLEPYYVYSPLPVTINLKLNNSTNIIKDESHTVYYSTYTKWNELADVLSGVDHTWSDEERRAYLASCNVIEMVKGANSEYTGNIPYSTYAWNLFVDGAAQDSTYDVINTKRTYLALGAKADGYVWDGTRWTSPGSSSNQIQTKDPSFTVVMDKNRTYTVFAYVKTDGEQKMPNNTINFCEVNVHVSTDGLEKLPYSSTGTNGALASHTNIRFNDGEDKHVLNQVLNNTFRFASGKQLIAYLQSTSDGRTQSVEINLGTITQEMELHLAYSTISVDTDNPLIVPYLNGVPYGSEIYLTAYAYSAAGTSPKTFTPVKSTAQIHVDPTHATLTGPTYHIKHHNSTITINATLGNAPLALVAIPQKFAPNYEVSTLDKSYQGTYYAYMFNQTNPNISKLVMTSQRNDVVFGFSTDSTLTGNLMSEVHAIHLNGQPIDVAVDWDAKTMLIAAAAGARYNYTTCTAVSGEYAYTFENVVDGNYAIYVGDNKVVTDASSVGSDKQILAVSGVVSANGEVQSANDGNPGVIVKCTKSTTIPTGLTVDFVRWDGTLSKPDYADKCSGNWLTHAHYKASSTITYGQPLNTVTVEGTTYLKVITETKSTQKPTESGSDEGWLKLKALNAYRIDTYLDNNLSNIFSDINTPVQVNKSPVRYETTGQSRVFYSIDKPQITAKRNIYDRLFEMTQDGNSAISGPTSVNGVQVYRVDYYTVNFAVSDTSLGTLYNDCLCNNGFESVIVAKYSKVTNNANDAVNLFISGSTQKTPYYTADAHHRQAIALSGTGWMSEFTHWTRSSGAMTDDITSTTTFTAHFEDDEEVISHKYTVTLHNKTNSHTLYALNFDNEALISKKVYAIHKTDMSVQRDGKTSLLVTGEMPGTPTISYSLFRYHDRAVLRAYLAPNQIVQRKVQNSVEVKLKLTGYTSELAHTVKLVNINDNSKVYTYDVPANTFVATFNVPSGYYQLYVDGIKYSTQFSYNTHGSNCKVDNNEGATLTGSEKVPHYSTDYLTGGIVHVGYTYTVRDYTVDRWTQIRHGKEVSDFSTLRPEFRPTISANKETLTTPLIDEDLVYNVYSSYVDKDYAPINIYAEVEMAYPVIVNSVLNGTLTHVFDSMQSSHDVGAYVKFEFSVDGGTNWTPMVQQLVNGQTTFFIPIGAQYRVIGASYSEFDTQNFITSGFSSTASTYTAATLTGDGDENNDGNIDDPGRTYYVHFYTVTVNAGQGIDDVNIGDNMPGTTPYDKDKQPDTAHVVPSVVGIYQRGATFNASAHLSDGEIPVSVKVMKNNSPYENRTVHLSTSATENKKTYTLKWDASTKTYIHNEVYGTETGTTYYVWVDGKYVGGQYTSEYGNATILVKPWIETAYWDADCTANNTVQVKHATGLTHNDTVNHPIELLVYATANPTKQATVQYWTLDLQYDAGITSVTTIGTYLHGQKPAIDAAVKSDQKDLGTTVLTVKLYLDHATYKGLKVYIGTSVNDRYEAYEISTGTYQTTHRFPSGTYNIYVSDPNNTLLDDGAVMGTIKLSSTRRYTWKYWAEGHVQCSVCGVVANCCDQTDCNAKNFCSNCTDIYDASCCNDGTGGHKWVSYRNTTTTTDWTGHRCNTSTPSMDCQDCLQKARTTKANSVLMDHPVVLKAITTYKDTFTNHNTTSLNFYVLQLHGDAGVQSVTINGKTYNATTTIRKHGATALASSTLDNKLRPERLWTNTKSETAPFKYVVALSGRTTNISANIKAPIKNHEEAKTQLSVTLTMNGQLYTGRNVTIGGYATTEGAPGIYITTHDGFVGGKTYDIVVDGRYAGRLYLESTRTYRWYQWSEPWNKAHYCDYHQSYHNNYVGSCTNFLTNDDVTLRSTKIENQTQFIHLVARTEFIDEFHSYIDANLPGGPDPHPGNPGNDYDDPYKDPTDDDFNPGNPNDHQPDYDPDEQPNPEYNPNWKPGDNPNYDPVNPTNPGYDPEDNPNGFKPDDENDGFYEDDIIPFFQVTITTKLDDVLTDDFPVKFENLTTGDTFYILPDDGERCAVVHDGKVYYPDSNKVITFIDKSGHTVSFNVNGDKIVIDMQNGDKYRISVLDEIEDLNNDDAINWRDITIDRLDDYQYTVWTENDNDETKNDGIRTINRGSDSVEIKFWSLTVDVYSDGKHQLPEFGRVENGDNNIFEAPVWMDDVYGANDNYSENKDDSYTDTTLKPVYDAHTVKVYMNNKPYNVDNKIADDDEAKDATKAYHLIDKEHGNMTSKKRVVVEYWSMNAEHFGGFTQVEIICPCGKCPASWSDECDPKTTAGATGNAYAQAYFLEGHKATFTSYLASCNEWIGWDATATRNTSTQWDGKVDHAGQTTTVEMKDAARYVSAHANTTYYVHYFLHAKDNQYNNDYIRNDAHADCKHPIWDNNMICPDDGEQHKNGTVHSALGSWYETHESYHVSKVEINNRDWIEVTVNGEPTKYSNFDAYKTVSNYTNTIQNGAKTTTISVVVDANQVGCQSFVDFYYAKDGSTPGGESNYPMPEFPGMQEAVKITYVMNGGTFNGSKNNYTEVHYAGTNIKLIEPVAPTNKKFVGWFLVDGNGTPTQFVGMIGLGADNFLLTKDTVVYAAYVDKLDLGITANDIYGTIKVDSKFMTSATIINHNRVSVTPYAHVNAKIRIWVNGKAMTDAELANIVSYFNQSCMCSTFGTNCGTMETNHGCHNIIVPGSEGTQLVWATIDTTGWSMSNTYQVEWYLDFNQSNCIYEDEKPENNSSFLVKFDKNNLGKHSVFSNTARPDYNTDLNENNKHYYPNADKLSSSNTAYSWQYWKWNNKNVYDGTFERVTESDKMNITILLRPENENGLRTYNVGNAFGFQHYYTRSGYGLSMHVPYADGNYSNIKLNSIVGTLEVLMTFPEYNYTPDFNNDFNNKFGSAVGKYTKLVVDPDGTGKWKLYFPAYSDYESADPNDAMAHYTPLWLADGEYTPVTHIRGMWTPLGEMTATVQQGEFVSTYELSAGKNYKVTENKALADKLGIYTNQIIIKGSLYDDMYDNP